MDGSSAHREVEGVGELKTANERVVWAHAFWARLNHRAEKFTPSVAKANADDVIRHARQMGVVDVMAESIVLASQKK